MAKRKEGRNGPIGAQTMHDVRINVTIWEYRDAFHFCCVISAVLRGCLADCHCVSIVL